MILRTSMETSTEVERRDGRMAAAVAPREPKASRTLLNFWLDGALFVTTAFVLWVSVMMQAVFPPPTAAAGWRLWGLSFDQWRDVQFYGLCAAAVLVLEHVVLHWSWVCGVAAARIFRVRSRPDEGSQALYGVGAFIVVLAVALGGVMAAMLTVQQPSRGQ